MCMFHECNITTESWSGPHWCHWHDKARPHELIWYDVGNWRSCFLVLSFGRITGSVHFPQGSNDIVVFLLRCSFWTCLFIKWLSATVSLQFACMWFYFKPVATSAVFNTAESCLHLCEWEQALFTADFLTCHSRRGTGVSNNTNDGSVGYKHVQYLDPEIKAAHWDSDFINLIIYTCALPAVSCQNVLCGKRLVLNRNYNHQQALMSFY